jgi:FAD/FMN-containing dehydrogenase
MFDGPVHLTDDAGYDVHRRSLNPAVDARPAMVVEAAGPDDVRAAVTAARQFDLPFTVQATGHGTHLANNGGILVSTSNLATVLVDPHRRVARVGPGARWGAVLAAAAPFGLAPLSGSSPSVGVTGYTLGGGMGWLSRRYGLAADSVLRAEVVTADGDLVTASVTDNGDLFWALRGGGANFGVVTSLEFRLYPVAQVYAGTAFFPADRAAETLATYRQWAMGAPDELSTAVLLRRLPETPDVPEPVRGKRVLAIKAMYAGQASHARQLLRPLWSAAGPVLWHDLRSIPYAQTSMGGTAARHLDFHHELPDGLIGLLVGAHEHTASVVNVEFRHWGGAISRPGPEAGPAGHRAAQFSVIVDAPDATVAQRLPAYGIGGSFLNFLNDPSRTSSAYTTSNYTRLRGVKRAYDPENFFRVNHNIPPARSSGHRRAPQARAS